MKSRKIILLAILGVFGVAVIFFVRNQAAAQSGSTEDVQLSQVERGALEMTISAAGTLRSPQSADLSWETTGQVASVSVQLGDRVRAGEVLAALDPDSLDASVIQASADLADAERDLEDLLNSNLPLAEAQQTVAEAREAVRVAQYSHDVQQAGHRATPEGIELARANLALAEEAVEKAEENYEGAQGELGKANALTRVAEAKSNYRSALATYNWYTGHPTDIQQAMLDADLSVALASLEEAERAYARLQTGPDGVAVAAAEARIAQAQATLAASRIVAPFDATVVALSMQPGDVVENGTAAVTLANLEILEVQVDVSEVDINRIAVGQEAQLTLDAVPDQLFSGRVSNITLSGQVSQGVVTFPITVEVIDPDPALKSGMTAAVSIVVDRREDVLLVPNRAVQVQAGQRVVVVMFEGQQISVPVSIGLSNESLSEVVDGALEEGDSVVLNASATASSLPQGGGGFFGGFRP